ncbi:cAMP phosphodiesterases class-II-domain-containing protein [Lipomyces tetrasporus]
MSGVMQAMRPAASLSAISPCQQQLGTGLLPYVSPLTNAAYVVRELVAAVCITHAHLDHLAGFVINSACFTAENPKKLAGLPWVVDAVLKHIFNNAIWPNMSNEGDDPIGMVTLHRFKYSSHAAGDDDDDEPVGVIEDSFDDEDGYETIANGLDIRAFRVSHGCVHYTGKAPKAYESSAYFLRDKHSGKEILMFGDVEPDSVSMAPQNRAVWIAAAQKFGRNKLSAIFIECSYASIQPEHSLFGHLSPPYLIQELKMFASFLRCPLPAEVPLRTAKSFPTVSGGPGGFANYSFFGESITAGTNSPAVFPFSLKQHVLLQQQQQQLQQSHHHPYRLHPHPHYHHHSKHKYMQQYSPSSSRRTSASSVESAGSAGSSPYTLPNEDQSVLMAQQVQRRASAVPNAQHPQQVWGPLSGLVVVITHIKGLTDDEELVTANRVPGSSQASRPAESIILSELEELLANEDDLAGLRFVLAKTGQSIVI